nr:uncharacterized protein LOC113714006 [Coffea arabica]
MKQIAKKKASPAKRFKMQQRKKDVGHQDIAAELVVGVDHAKVHLKSKTKVSMVNMRLVELQKLMLPDMKLMLVNIRLRKPQKLMCKTDFINAAKSHGVKYGRKIKFKKNDSSECKAICNGKRCMWNIYCSVRSDKVTFQIKSMLLTHTCGRTTYHGLASVTYLANKYLEDIRLNPDFNVGDFMIKVHKDLGVSITPNVGYKVKAKAKQMIHGDFVSQYSKLWSYCEELQKANPDSNVFMTTTENNEGDDEFQRFYVYLDGCKRGFLKGCRYVVSLDGCHLRGCHKEVLLTAVGVDPNDQLFLIVYAVVETENKNSWKWFVEELKRDLEIIDESIWTFITNKQKGLVQVIQEVLSIACVCGTCTIISTNNIQAYLSRKGYELQHELLIRTNLLG